MNKYYHDVVKDAVVLGTSNHNIPLECDSKAEHTNDIKSIVSDFSEDIDNEYYFLNRASSRIVGYVKK